MKYAMIALAIVAMLAMPASAMTQPPPYGEARSPPGEVTLDPGTCRNFETLPGVCDELPKPTNPCNALLVTVSERCGNGGGGPGIGVPSLGGGETSCHPTNAVCAMAGADSHIERIKDAPNVDYMATMGGGQSNTALAGSAEIATSLGSTICHFSGNSGCFRTWSDISNGGCKASWAKTTATASIFVISTSSFDGTCEER